MPFKFGIDSVAAVTNTSALRAHGVEFSVRYISAPGNSKNITRTEAETIRRGGLDVVLVWEGAGTEPLAGKNQGTQDARLAKAEAEAVGAPPHSPIYFALDQDPNGLSAAQWAEIDAYFKAVAAVIGHKCVGAYGGYAFIKHLFDKKLITYGWQTYGWSNGRWDIRAQLRQYLNAQVIAGMNVDFDHATHADYGQWGGANTPGKVDLWGVEYRNELGRIQHRNTKHPRGWALRYAKPFQHGAVTFRPLHRK